MAMRTFPLADAPEMHPDPRLTPGSLNPRVNQADIAQTICNRNWQTGSIRDTVSSPAQKNTTYNAYGIPYPLHNTGATQVCEFDHLTARLEIVKVEHRWELRYRIFSNLLNRRTA